MATKLLTASGIKSLPEGKHSDGGGLFLWVRNGRGRWYINAGGRGKSIAIGGYPEIGLGQARDEALKIRGKIALGLEVKETPKQIHTIASLAKDVHDRKQLTNDKYKAQWLRNFDTYIDAKLLKKDITQIEVIEIEEAITKVIKKTPESGKKLKQQLGEVYRRAVLLGIVKLNIPLALTDEIKRIAPKRQTNHHAAMDWRLVPKFYALLAKDENNSMGKLAFRFAILTAARAQEVRLMTWQQINGDIRTCPPELMKMRLEHLVPLVDEAKAILELAKAHPNANATYVFQSPRMGDLPLSNAVFDELIKDRPKDVFKEHFTQHGFRATFKTWAMETNASRENVIEFCLAHKTNDPYNRALYLAERAQLLKDWATHLTSEL